MSIFLIVCVSEHVYDGQSVCESERMHNSGRGK